MQRWKNYISTTYGGCASFPEKIFIDCPAYTEANEYGCTFGNVYGFYTGENYEIKAEYELYPENLFKINDRYYIKFIAYSANSHKLLIKGSNFIIPEEAISKILLPSR